MTIDANVIGLIVQLLTVTLTSAMFWRYRSQYIDMRRLYERKAKECDEKKRIMDVSIQALTQRAAALEAETEEIQRWACEVGAKVHHVERRTIQ